MKNRMLIRSRSNRACRCLWALPLMIAAWACPLEGRQAGNPIPEGVRVSEVYKRYLEFPEPAAGIEAEVNPPLLRWPRAQGKGVRYDVRLSRDRSFSDETEHEVSASAWAMYNPHEIL